MDWEFHRTLDGCTQIHKRRLPESDPRHLTTKRCCKRGCHWCDFRLRQRHLAKLQRLQSYVMDDPYDWRFMTFTLPGDWYDVRCADLATQLEVFRSAKRKWRARRGRVTSSYVIEHTRNSSTGNWNVHSHDLVRNGNEFVDFNSTMDEMTSQWLECVDKKTTRTLREWGLSDRQIAGGVLDVRRVDKDGLAGYMAKASKYMTKGISSLTYRVGCVASCPNF